MSRYDKQMKQRVHDLQSEMEMDREQRKREHAKGKEYRAYQSLPSYTKMEFWCDHDQIDFVAPAYKVWVKSHEIGVWHSFCPLCDQLVVRHITSKRLDPYYARSEKVRVMRGEAAKDILQPHDRGFQMAYGDPFEHYYRRFQQQQEAIFNKYAALGLAGKTMDEKDEDQQIRDTL